MPEEISESSGDPVLEVLLYEVFYGKRIRSEKDEAGLLFRPGWIRQSYSSVG